MKIEKINALRCSRKDRVIQRTSYYCGLCDYITDDTSLWNLHDVSACRIGKHEVVDEAIAINYCKTCHMYISGKQGDLAVHPVTVEHKIMCDLRDLIKNASEFDDQLDRSAALSMFSDDARSSKYSQLAATGEKLSEDDNFLLYIGHRFKLIKDESIKLKVKLAIDDVFCKCIKYSDL
jgi:hypothetical protein